MGWSYYIYTSLSANQIDAVLEELMHVSDRYMDAYGNIESEDFFTSIPELSTFINHDPMIGLYFQDEKKKRRLIDHVRECHGALPKKIEELLSQCKSAIEIDRPAGTGGHTRLQASELIYLLQHAGKITVMNWGDYSLETAEDAISQLRKKDRPFADYEAPRPATDEGVEPEGEGTSAGQIFDLMEGLSENPETAVDLKKWLERVKGDAKAYLATLLHDGPDSTEAMAKRLKRPAKAIAEIEETLLEQLAELAET